MSDLMAERGGGGGGEQLGPAADIHLSAARHAAGVVPGQVAVEGATPVILPDELSPSAVLPWWLNPDGTYRVGVHNPYILDWKWLKADGTVDADLRPEWLKADGTIDLTLKPWYLDADGTIDFDLI